MTYQKYMKDNIKKMQTSEDQYERENAAGTLSVYISAEQFPIEDAWIAEQAIIEQCFEHEPEAWVRGKMIEYIGKNIKSNVFSIEQNDTMTKKLVECLQNSKEDTVHGRDAAVAGLADILHSQQWSAANPEAKQRQIVSDSLIPVVENGIANYLASNEDKYIRKEAKETLQKYLFNKFLLTTTSSAVTPNPVPQPK